MMIIAEKYEWETASCSIDNEKYNYGSGISVLFSLGLKFLFVKYGVTE